MFKKIFRFSIVLLLAGLMTSFSLADEVKGRDVVAQGTVQVLSGTLRPEGGHDWFLITGDGEVELHLGPDRFRKAQGFTMKEGQQATVTGFVCEINNEKHMAPITLTIGSETIQLRDNEGKSLWAGTEFGRKDLDEGAPRQSRGRRSARPTAP